MPRTPVAALAVDVPEDVPVVHLAGGGLLAARVVALLEVGDLFPRAVDVRDDVPLGDLLVVHVEEDLARGASHRPADLEGLRDPGEEEPGVVLPGVEWLEDHHEPGRLEDFGQALQVLDDVGGLVVPLEAHVVPAGDDRRPLRVHALRDLDRGLPLGQDVRADLRLRRGERDVLEVAHGHEDAHGQAEAGHLPRHPLLLRDGPPRHAVVLPGGEALVGAELELVHEVLARVVLEHAEVGRVLETERSRGRRGERPPAPDGNGGAGRQGGLQQIASVHRALHPRANPIVRPGRGRVGRGPATGRG